MRHTQENLFREHPELMQNVNPQEAYALGWISLQEYIIITGTTDAWDIVRMLDSIEAIAERIRLDREEEERYQEEYEQFCYTYYDHYLTTEDMLEWIPDLYWYEHYKYSYDGNGKSIYALRDDEWYRAEHEALNQDLDYLLSGEPERIKREEQIRLLADEAIHLGISDDALARFTWNVLANERERRIFWEEYTLNK